MTTNENKIQQFIINKLNENHLIDKTPKYTWNTISDSLKIFWRDYYITNNLNT